MRNNLGKPKSITMRRALAVLLALSSLALAIWAAAQARGVAPAPLTQTDIGDRLRVFARPGDFKLENTRATAVVRKQDGWLTEFWQNRARLPSSEQLGTITEIDGIWQIHPLVFTLKDKKAYPVMASRVAALADGIETDGIAEVGAVRYRALTQFRLDRERALVRMTTRFSVEDGAASGPIGLGDLVKWGNVPYIVEGLAKPRMKYEGPARFVGRRGAGGDLLLRRSDAQPFFLDYGAKFRGFQGNIHALYARVPIPAGGSISVERELSYESLPVARRPEPKVRGAVEIGISDEAGRPLAAKVRIDREGSEEPLFEDDGGLDGADRFMWTGNGRVFRELAEGRYRLLVTSGIERDAARFTLRIRAGKTEKLSARLPRVVATPGSIGADLHLHQAPSVDADLSLAARVIAIAAEGVEFAVATDHYVVTDLGPTVRTLQLDGVLAAKLLTVAGCEVSTLGNRFGHFNVFPLALGSNVLFDNTTPSALFADARAKSPRGILQVNHPRWDPKIGYFSHFELDEDTGEPKKPGFDPRFDTLEVYNGEDAKDLKDVKKVLEDWIHLLGRGHRYAATGSSDSHNLAFLDPGLPRTLVRHGVLADDARDVEAPVDQVLAALKAGRSIVTSGPIIEASIAGRGPGETVRGAGTKARLDVVVRAAPWIDVTSLEVLVGPKARRAGFALVRRSNKVERLRRSFELEVEPPTFVIVVAEGARGLPNASRDHTLPFAFTNPIWVE